MTTNATNAHPEVATPPYKVPLCGRRSNAVMHSLAMKLLLLFFLCSGAFAVNGQVHASFTIDDTASCAPMIVHFTNTSTGATSYSWNLGNGSPLSTFTDVSGTYTTAGIYTITLTASNGTTTSTYTATIHAYAIPTVIFSATDTAICPGTPATFISSSVPGAWGSLSYTWNFGDGSSSTAASPTHTFPSPAYYNVTLFATNSKMCINSLSKLSYIHVLTPAFVGFTASSTYLCRIPATESFTSTTIGTSPLSYSWEFGDGGTSAVTNPSHVYTANGGYTITLKVTDGHGCQDSLVYPDYITVENLTAAFTVSPVVCTNAPATFHNTSTAHISSQWFFGDGGTSVADSPTYAYAATGTYTVKLVVYDGTCYDTATRTITVSHASGSFNITPAQPCTPPQPLTFTASVPAGSTVAWYSMDSFVTGIGSPYVGFYLLGTGTTLTHTFPIVMYPTLAGPVPLGFIDSFSMIITNSYGCKDTVGKIDTVNYPSLDLSASGPLSGCTPVNVHFYTSLTSSVFDPYSGPPWYAFGPPSFLGPPYDIGFPYPYSIGSYSWDFGDGSPSSTAATPVHTYTLVGGVYGFSCAIVTSNGCPVSESSTAGHIAITVGAPPPTPSFTITPTRSCPDRPLHFTSTATGVFNHYSWDFRDGNKDTTADPVHAYTVSGIYDVQFITEYNGCPSGTASAMDSIDSPTSLINYHFNCIPKNEIAFHDYSLGENSHLWLFGDGTTSTAANPVHDYPSLSTYTATLTTYNVASGCRDTIHSIIKLQGLRDTLLPASASICKDFVDTIKTHVFDTSYIDTTWATKYMWYVGGTFIDSVSRTYYYDTVSYAFHTPGTFPVTLILTDNHNCLDTFTTNILVAHPIDSFGYTVSSPCAPVPIHLTDHSTDVPGAAITNFLWYFGDGDSLSTTSGTLVTHTYVSGGTFTLEEIVTDNVGCKDTSISSSHPVVHQPTASFAAYSTNICARTGAHFINTSIGMVSALWFFGDGDTSSLPAPAHVYSAAGVYTVTLVVTGALGCTDTATSVGYITVNPTPFASFTMADSFAVCPPLNVSCINTSTGASSYYWTFGGVTSSSATSASGVFVAPGYYAIKLFAANAYGCTDSAIHYASLFGYTGAFTYSPVSGCSPLHVHFSASLSSVSGIVWDFNDGITTSATSLDSISHTYIYPGAYVPKLVLTDSTGCSAFSLGLDTIKADTVMPNFIFSPDPVCQGNLLTFSDASTSSFSSGKTWLWSFAAGATSTLSAPTYSYPAMGVYPVSMTVTDSLGCSGSVTKSVTVNPSPTAITGIAVICTGSATTLTDTITGGVWSTASSNVSVNSASGVVTAISTGTAVITYSLGLGCTATKIITINAIGAITGTTSICYGTTTSLSDPGGGAWTSSNSAIAAIGSSGTVTGASAGHATITYSLSPSCYTTAAMTVNPIPSLISGPATVCLFGSASLGDTAAGGTWSIAPAAVAAIGSSSGMVTGSALGTAIATYSLGFGCIKYDTITVIPLPAAIGGAKHACPGSTTALTDTGGGVWNTGSALVSLGSATGIVTGITTGVATITYTASGCAITTPVTVNPLPKIITGRLNVCHGSTTALADSSAGGSWSSGATTIATVVSGTGVVSAIIPGAAPITYTLPTGCTSTTTVNVISDPAFITGPLVTCYGTTTTLTDSTSGGSWSSASGIASVNSATGLVTGGTAYGTAIITYSLGGSCYRTASVIVDSFPATITGASSLCLGTSTTLSDFPVGGTWSSSNPGIISVGAATGVITGVVAATAIITYSIGPGCTTHTLPITVNPLPPAIIGPGDICAGYSTLLHDPGVGGVWSSSVPSAATISTTGLVSAGMASGATVISYYTAASGCAATLDMDVIAVPPITGITALCGYGGTVRVADSIPGGTWTAALVTITDSGVVSAYAAGPGTIYYTLSSGCFASAPVTVNPLPAPITGNPRLCTGLTTDLGDLTTGGVWSSSVTSVAGTGSAAGLITGMSPGESVITYTLPVTGCTQSVTVTVSSLPSPVSGATNVCVGATTALGDTSAGGIWTSSSPSIATIGSSSGIVTGLSAGAVTVTYYLGVSCSVTGAVTIDPLPALYTVTGGGSYCAGGTGVAIGLASSATGVSYQLYSGGAAIGSAVAGSGAALGFGLQTVAGVYSVIATNTAAGCVAGMHDSVTVSITPDVTPTVTINPVPGDTLCAGVMVHLIANPANGGSAPAYQWSVDGTTAGTDSSHYSYVPANGDSVTVEMVSNAHCAVPDTVSNTIHIDVEPLLLPSVTLSAHPGTTILSGMYDTLTATVTGGGATPTYQWIVNGVVVAGANSRTFGNNNFNNGDSVCCVVMSSGPCGGLIATQCEIITVINNEGINDPTQPDDLRVLPNPNNGSFIIQGTLGSNVDEEVSLTLKDVLGQIVYKNKIMAHSGMMNEHILLNTKLANGTYILNVSSGTGNRAFHIVIEE